LCLGRVAVLGVGPVRGRLADWSMVLVRAVSVRAVGTLRLSCKNKSSEESRRERKAHKGLTAVRRNIRTEVACSARLAMECTNVLVVSHVRIRQTKPQSIIASRLPGPLATHQCIPREED